MVRDDIDKLGLDVRVAVQELVHLMRPVDSTHTRDPEQISRSHRGQFRTITRRRHHWSKGNITKRHNKKRPPCWYTDGRLPCRCEVRPHSLCGWHVSFRMYTFETTHDLCWRTIPSEGSFYVSGAVVVGSFMLDT